MKVEVPGVFVFSDGGCEFHFGPNKQHVMQFHLVDSMEKLRAAFAAIIHTSMQEMLEPAPAATPQPATAEGMLGSAEATFQSAQQQAEAAIKAAQEAYASAVKAASDTVTN